MLLISEQQTFAKLRLAPADFIKMLDENPSQAMEYIIQLQGEREKEPSRKKSKSKDPNVPKTSRGKKSAALDFTTME